MKGFLIFLFFFVGVVFLFSRETPFPISPAIVNGKSIKIKGRANDSFVAEISRFPTVILKKSGSSYTATVKFSTFHDVVTRYTLEPLGGAPSTTSWSTPQMEHMRVYSNLQEGKKYKIIITMTYKNYKSRPDTYYKHKPLVIRPPNDITDQSNMSIFISKSHDHNESDLEVSHLKDVDLGDSEVRKRMRGLGIKRHESQRKAKIWEYAATGSKVGLNKSEEFARLAQKIGGDKIKGIKQKLIGLVGGSGNVPAGVPSGTSAEGRNLAVFAMSKFRKALLDKDNDGIPDISGNKIILYPDRNKEGMDAYVKKTPEFVFNLMKNGNYTNFNDFLKKAGSRIFQIRRKYKIPGDPPDYFTITVKEFYPLKIAVDYDNIPGSPGKIRYIDLWKYLEGELFITNTNDEVRTTPLIPSNDTSDATAGPLVDDYQVVSTIKVQPLSYPE